MKGGNQREDRGRKEEEDAVGRQAIRTVDSCSWKVTRKMKTRMKMFVECFLFDDTLHTRGGGAW